MKLFIVIVAFAISCLVVLGMVGICAGVILSSRISRMEEQENNNDTGEMR
nr:MAG TPA: hypothetical protein [Caudoviricetes sp.]